MIVIDLEFTSFDFEKGDIVSIGAVDFLKPENTFYQEYRVRDDARVDEEARKVIGMTMEQLKDKNKPLFTEAIQEFIDWVNKTGHQIFAGQSMSGDMAYLLTNFRRAGVDWPWGWRTVDLHAYTFCHEWKKNGVQPLKENRHSAMGLSKECEMAGFKDPRKSEHNALHDAKITAECFSRWLFNKPMFKEFEE